MLQKDARGFIECATLGVVVLQVWMTLAMHGQVEARRLSINQQLYVEGKLTPYPHVDVVQLIEQ